MVRNYKRKTDRRAWSAEGMKRALEELQGGQKTAYVLSKEYQIPLTTLIRSSKKGGAAISGGRVKPVFSETLERELVMYVLEMSKRLLGLTFDDLRGMAFELATANNLEMPGSWKRDKKAGRDWAAGFIKRFPAISLRKPEATSLARASGFNKPSVEKFFEVLGGLMVAHHFPPHRIFNVDETGLSTTHVPPKVLARAGQKQIGKITSQERGKNVTAVCCMNAVGTFVPPMMIFPRVRFRDDLIREAPIGTIGVAQQSGWMNKELFVEWLQHFVKVVKPTVDEPVLLVLDNHCSHVSLETVTFAREHFLTMLSFPPHCSHRLQPLDRTVYGPMKTYYNKACNDFMISNPGVPITEYHVAGRFKIAYERSATMVNAKSGFLCTGISPYNSLVFSDDEFAASLTTDRPLDGSSLPMVPSTAVLSAVITSQPAAGETQVMRKQLPALEPVADVTLLQPCTTTPDPAALHPPTPPEPAALQPTPPEPAALQPTPPEPAALQPTPPEPAALQPSPPEPAALDRQPAVQSLILPQTTMSPQMLKPYPRAVRANSAKSRSLCATILTSSPYKKQLKEKLVAKQPNGKKVTVGTTKNRKVQSQPKENKSNRKTKRASDDMATKKKPTKKLKQVKNVTQISNTDETYNCPGCDELYVDPPTEDWIYCNMCMKWWHKACTSYEGGDFQCDLCS